MEYGESGTVLDMSTTVTYRMEVGLHGVRVLNVSLRSQL